MYVYGCDAGARGWADGSIHRRRGSQSIESRHLIRTPCISTINQINQPPIRLGYTYSGSNNNGGLPPLQAALPEEHTRGLLWAGR